MYHREYQHTITTIDMTIAGRYGREGKGGFKLTPLALTNTANLHYFTAIRIQVPDLFVWKKSITKERYNSITSVFIHMYYISRVLRSVLEISSFNLDRILRFIVTCWYFKTAH